MGESGTENWIGYRGDGGWGKGIEEESVGREGTRRNSVELFGSRTGSGKLIKSVFFRKSLTPETVEEGGEGGGIGGGRGGGGCDMPSIDLIVNDR